ncbi:MAG: insulinase family protein [Myxococcales bacterium]|nr:insulinase family protein [Myxococcales bacterium]
MTRCTVLLGLLTLACGPKTDLHSPSNAAEPVVPEQPIASDFTAKSDGPALLPTALANDPMGVTIHRLSNGLTVYISTDRSEPSISSWIAVGSGSRHDPADSTGLAHYLEHMLFKGTSKMGTLDFEKEKPHLDRIAELYDQLRAATGGAERKAILVDIDAETIASSQYSVPNEFDNLYASLGIDGVNAFTSDEQTVYIATVPTNRFQAWAQIEGERFTDPQFRLFYPELESVYEEKNRSLDSPQSRLFQALSKALYPNHPYGTQPTIGHAEHLKTPAYGDMVDYYENWYRPNNMAIVLAGDIDADTALPALEKRFAALEARALPELPASTLIPPSERQDIEIVAPGEQSIVMTWPTVSAGHADEMALQVMDLVIDNSSTGLLNIELVLAQKLPSASSFVQVLREAGMWFLTGTARDGQTLEEVESLLTGVVAKLKAGDFTQADLDAIVLNSEIARKRRLESNGARVEVITSAFIEGRPWEAVVGQAEALRKVTREDVMRVAKTYLTDAPVVVKRVRGEFQSQKVEKPSISAIKIDSSRKSPYAKAVMAAPVKELEPQWLVDGKHYERSALPAGSLIAVANERNDLFSISYQYDFGERQEPLLCFAMDLLERSGAGERSAATLQKELYAIGSSINFGCGSQTASIHVSGIDRKMEASLALLEEWIAAPKLEGDALGKLLANTLSGRKDAMNEPSVIARALAGYAARGKDSRFLKVPSNAILGKAKAARLIKLLAALPNIKHRTSYLGPRAAADVGKLIAFGSKHRKAKKRRPLRFQTPKLRTLYFVDQKVAQAQIRVGFPAAPISFDDRVKANLFNQYVGGGMGGLIFQEIREARGLAYSAWASYAASNRIGDDTAVMAGLGTQADKSVEAVSTLLSLVVPLKVESNRYATAVTSLKASYRKTRISPRSRASAVFGWEDLGKGDDPRPKQFAALDSTPAADMESFANARTRLPATFAITGDSTRIDIKALAAAASIGKIKVMKASQLFGY